MAWCSSLSASRIHLFCSDMQFSTRRIFPCQPKQTLYGTKMFWNWKPHFKINHHIFCSKWTVECVRIVLKEICLINLFISRSLTLVICYWIHHRPRMFVLFMKCNFRLRLLLLCMLTQRKQFVKSIYGVWFDYRLIYLLNVVRLCERIHLQSNGFHFGI